MWMLKKMVSGDKNRFQEDGFDLDLTYVTDRIIAMGFPSEGAEAIYRNSMVDTTRMLETRHRCAMWACCRVLPQLLTCRTPCPPQRELSSLQSLSDIRAQVRRPSPLRRAGGAFPISRSPPSDSGAGRCILRRRAPVACSRRTQRGGRALQGWQGPDRHDDLLLPCPRRPSAHPRSGHGFLQDTARCRRRHHRIAAPVCRPPTSMCVCCCCCSRTARSCPDADTSSIMLHWLTAAWSFRCHQRCGWSGCGCWLCLLSGGLWMARPRCTTLVLGREAGLLPRVQQLFSMAWQMRVQCGSTRPHGVPVSLAPYSSRCIGQTFPPTPNPPFARCGSRFLVFAGLAANVLAFGLGTAGRAVPGSWGARWLQGTSRWRCSTVRAGNGFAASVCTPASCRSGRLSRVSRSRQSTTPKNRASSTPSSPSSCSWRRSYMEHWSWSRRSRNLSRRRGNLLYLSSRWAQWRIAPATWLSGYSPAQIRQLWCLNQPQPGTLLCPAVLCYTDVHAFVAKA